MEKLIGFILPPFIDLINRKIQDSDLRFWVSLGACAVVGVVVFWASGLSWTVEGVINSILWVFALAQISYKGLWENSEVRDSLSLKA